MKKQRKEEPIDWDRVLIVGLMHCYPKKAAAMIQEASRSIKHPKTRKAHAAPLAEAES